MQLHNHYKKELYFPFQIKFGDKNGYVKKMQEFLVLSNIILQFEKTLKLIPDSDFGNITLHYLKIFQESVYLPVTGIADERTISKLTKNFKDAFTTIPFLLDFRDAVLFIANNHLVNNGSELYSFWKINDNYNKGPWVRAYCNGDDYDGNTTGPKWCAGFVKTILDLACAKMNFDYTIFFKNSLSCDEIAYTAKLKGRLKNFSNSSDFKIHTKPGDLFLTYTTYGNEDFVHIGIIIKINDNGAFETIEGNSSEDSEKTHAGYEIISKRRNFNDVFYFDENNIFTKNQKNAKFKQYYYFYNLDI